MRIRQVIYEFYNSVPNELVEFLDKRVPDRIAQVGNEWGYSDTEFRDKLFDYLEGLLLNRGYSPSQILRSLSGDTI